MRSSVGTSSAPYVSHFATDTVAEGAARANGTRRPTPRPTTAVEPARNCLRDSAGATRIGALRSRGDLQGAVYRHRREVELDAGLDLGSRGRRRGSALSTMKTRPLAQGFWNHAVIALRG